MNLKVEAFMGALGFTQLIISKILMKVIFILVVEEGRGSVTRAVTAIGWRNKLPWRGL